MPTSWPTVDPLILDLGAPGLAFTSGENSVSFDINADGVADQMAWTAGEDGILALDVDGNGTIDNGSEIFSPWFAGGSHAGSLAALATLDDNGDGVIDSGDAAFGNLQVWQDLDHDGVSDAGELKSLADHGITGINLDATPVDGTVDGQQLVAEGTFNKADGTTGTFVEVAFETALGAADAPSLADTFVVGPNDALLTIDGYSFAEGDSLDLSALLDANFTPEFNVSDFVQLARKRRRRCRPGGRRRSGQRGELCRCRRAARLRRQQRRHRQRGVRRAGAPAHHHWLRPRAELLLDERYALDIGMFVEVVVWRVPRPLRG